MARKVQVILSDDLDENVSADETVSFALDGTNYEIDLSDKNATEMRDAFSRYVQAARKVGRAGRASRGAGAARARAAPRRGGGAAPRCSRGGPWARGAGRCDPGLGTEER